VLTKTLDSIEFLTSFPEVMLHDTRIYLALAVFAICYECLVGVWVESLSVLGLWMTFEGDDNVEASTEIQQPSSPPMNLTDELTPGPSTAIKRGGYAN
jgi:hypothetical protein